MRKIIDLSHTIYDGLVTYKGLPPPLICDFLSREEAKKIYPPGTSFQIAKIEMVSNTGTYIDCPFHRFETGKDLSEIELKQLVNLPAVCVHVEGQQAISRSPFKNIDISHKAVLIHTGWAAHFNTEHYYTNHPFLTADAAQYLVENEVLLVGIDSYNIDDTRTYDRPVHTLLLGKDILIVEHMTGLEQLPDKGFTFSAVPPKVKGVGSFPVRAYAVVG